MFVYNHLGAIDEAALDKLALVAEVSSSLAAGGEGKQFTPAFLWLLRDFYLDLRAEDGRAMTPSECASFPPLIFSLPHHSSPSFLR